MFDFNCDLAQEFGVYKNETAYEVAKYMSSVNISAGFHAGDALSIKKALEFAKDRNIAIGAHIGYPDISGFGKRTMELDFDEIDALVLYQTGAVVSFAKTMGLEVEHVRCHGAMNKKLSEDFEFARTVALAVKKINPWLNLYVQNIEVKKFLEEEVKINCAYEKTYENEFALKQLVEADIIPETIHFKNPEDAKRACEIIKPAPVNYNRVQGQI